MNASSGQMGEPLDDINCKHANFKQVIHLHSLTDNNSNFINININPSHSYELVLQERSFKQ